MVVVAADTASQYDAADIFVPNENSGSAVRGADSKPIRNAWLGWRKAKVIAGLGVCDFAELKLMLHMHAPESGSSHTIDVGIDGCFSPLLGDFALVVDMRSWSAVICEARPGAKPSLQRSAVTDCEDICSYFPFPIDT
jgi:hypothetical protein